MTRVIARDNVLSMHANNEFNTLLACYIAPWLLRMRTPAVTADTPRRYSLLLPASQVAVGGGSCKYRPRLLRLGELWK